MLEEYHICGTLKRHYLNAKNKVINVKSHLNRRVFFVIIKDVYSFYDCVIKFVLT